MSGAGQDILTNDYSTIRNRVNEILGVGAGTSGYGQLVSAPSAAVGDTITRDMWLALRTDMIKIKNHQTNISVGGATTLDNQNLVVPTTSMTITDSFRDQYDRFAIQLQIDKFLLSSAQQTIDTLVETVRTDSWNGTIAQIITVSGSPTGRGAAENLRFFFNAGGSLQLSASRSGVSTPKNDEWTRMLYQMGNITMNYTSTISDTGYGIGSIIGFNDLNTSDQLLYTARATGSYENNQYIVNGKISADGTKIILTIYFIDGSVSGAQDLNVSGQLISTLKQVRATGNNVAVASLSATQAGLDLGTPTVAYTIIPRKTQVYEGDTIIFDINTNDVPTNTNPTKIVYWKILGSATNVDFADGALSGSVNIGSNGTATIVKTIQRDTITEVPKSFVIQLTSAETNGTVLQTSANVYLSDVVAYSITAVNLHVVEGGSVLFNVTANVFNGN